MVGGGRGAPQKRGAERWASQRNGVQGDWGVPKAMDAPATKKSSSMGTKFLLQEKSSSMDSKSLLREKSSNMEVRCEGVEGATADFVCFHCPLLASAEAPPLLSEKSRYGRQDQQFGRAHLARHSTGGEKAAWGRSCGSAKLLAGTLRCLRLGWRLPLERSPAKELGRCPKPHKGRRPLTLQGGFPLDPFLAPRLERFSLTGSSSTL